MGTIIIKGDFTITGDIPGLSGMCKRFKFMELKTREIPNIIINQFNGIAENIKKEHPKDCKGCPDCPGIYICNKCHQSFPHLNTEHECR